ncbi:MAG: hypothetical protein AABZ76_14290 [Pseudomonadota bacterium]
MTEITKNDAAFIALSKELLILQGRLSRAESVMRFASGDTGLVVSILGNRAPPRPYAVTFDDADAECVKAYGQVLALCADLHPALEAEIDRLKARIKSHSDLIKTYLEGGDILMAKLAGDA